MDVLLVDGYNVIGAWPELRKLKEKDFAGARDKLIEKMAEYQAVTGYRIIIVFDAHLVPGVETKLKRYRVEVVYTRENETADERIEKLAGDLKNIKTQIRVATSDYTEQWTIFSQGALRVSARELLAEVESADRQISKTINERHQKRVKSKIPLSDDVAEMFEKWRRGER